MDLKDEWAGLDRLAGEAARGVPFEELVAQLVAATVDAVEEAEAGSVTLVESGEIRSAAEVGRIAARAEAIQKEIHEGPCVTAAVGWRTYVVDDVTSDERWPNFHARLADETDVRSILAYAIPGEGAPRAALNLYASKPRAFDRDAERIGALFAAQVSVALALEDGRRQSESRVYNLEQAVITRDVIGQAKGILMEREGCSADEAFEMLKQASQHLNRKLRDVAEAVVDEAERKGREPGH